MNNKDNEIKPITKDSGEKDLGIIYEENLKFNKHITTTVNRANRQFGMIKRTFLYVDNDLLLTLYKTLVRSVLDYGSPVWNHSTKTYRQMLANVQRRATKMFPKLKTLSYQERLWLLNLPSLYYRRKRYDLKQLFKIVVNIEDTSIDNLVFQLMTTSQEGTYSGFKSLGVSRLHDSRHSQFVVSTTGRRFQIRWLRV